MSLIREIINKKQIDEKVVAYIAGFFDAEGYIGVSKRTLSLQIRISNTNLDVLKRIKSAFKGEIYSKGAYKKEHKNQWIWYIGDRNKLRFFLETILSYSTVKKSQIELGLEYLKKTTKGTNIKLSSEERKLRESYMDKFEHPKHYHYTEKEINHFNDTIDNMKHFCQEFNESVYAYVCGFFDGEGCVDTHKIKKTNNIILRTSLQNTYPPILIGMKQVFGGNVNITKKLEEHLNWRQEWCWSIYSRECLKFFLTKTFRYSIIKRPQIELGLKFLELTSDGRGKGTPLQEQQTRQFIADKLSEMKDVEYTKEEIRELNEQIKDMNVDKLQRKIADYK